MKTSCLQNLLAFALAMPAFAQIPAAVMTANKVQTRIGTLEYKDGMPTRKTVAKAYDYLDLMHGLRLM